MHISTQPHRVNRRGYYKPDTPSGSMTLKRSAPAFEHPSGWNMYPFHAANRDSPKITPPHSSVSTRVAHYASIWVDNEGNLKFDESRSIQEQGVSLFTEKVRQNFLTILGERNGFHQSIAKDTVQSLRDVKQRRVNTPWSATGDDHLGAICGHCPPDSSFKGSLPLRIGDTSGVISHYEKALEDFNQRNCSMVAKAFIKEIEPHKQTDHPYNGGRPGTRRDPEKTKPAWWPSGVMHREPDHLRKALRIQLLIHLICKLGNQGITADKLKRAVGDTQRSLKDPSHVEIIYEILRVRHMEEHFERGEADGNRVVYVMDRGRKPKRSKKESTQTRSNAFVEDTSAKGPVTPTSTAGEEVPAVITHGEVMPEATHWLDNRASQHILSNPMAGGILSTDDSSVFGYSDSNLFQNSSPGQPCTGGPGNYISLGTPPYPQDIFSQVRYSAPIDVPPPYMYYPMT